MSRLEFCREQREAYGDGFEKSDIIVGHGGYISVLSSIGRQGFGYERDENNVPLHICLLYTSDAADE